MCVCVCCWCEGKGRRDDFAVICWQSKRNKGQWMRFIRNGEKKKTTDAFDASPRVPIIMEMPLSLALCLRKKYQTPC